MGAQPCHLRDLVLAAHPSPRFHRSCSARHGFPPRRGRRRSPPRRAQLFGSRHPPQKEGKLRRVEDVPGQSTGSRSNVPLPGEDIRPCQAASSGLKACKRRTLAVRQGHPEGRGLKHARPEQQRSGKTWIKVSNWELPIRERFKWQRSTDARWMPPLRATSSSS